MLQFCNIPLSTKWHGLLLRHYFISILFKQHLIISYYFHSQQLSWNTLKQGWISRGAQFGGCLESLYVVWNISTHNHSWGVTPHILCLYNYALIYKLIANTIVIGNISNKLAVTSKPSLHASGLQWWREWPVMVSWCDEWRINGSLY